MNPRVLILGSLYDFSVDIVARALSEGGVPYVRLNREQFTDLRLTLDPIESTLRIRGLDLETSVGPKLDAVWYRAPIFLRNTTAGSLSPAEQLERSQWSAFLRSMTVFHRARWMNHPADTYQAECKPFQLKVAVECGFSVPETIITNDATSVWSRFKDMIAVKSVDTAYMRDGSDVLFAYTSLIRPEVLCDENTSQAPLIAQQAFQDKTDIRVTVVGNSLWAYRITVDGAGAFGDWRLRKRKDIQYEQVDLSESVEKKCFLLSERLRLPFAAIDLVETNSRIFFMEVNPTGEWAWLPGAGESAGAAIAAWLSEGRKPEATP